MFHIVLVHPQIPPNTGNIIRLAANTGSKLHLIKPFGFSLEQKQLRRSALDYADLTNVKNYADFDCFISQWQKMQNQQAYANKLYFFSTKAQKTYNQIEFKLGDGLVFGSETKGLSDEIRNKYNDYLYKIPMIKGNRSLNLSNSVAIVIYDAWRQNNFSQR